MSFGISFLIHGVALLLVGCLLVFFPHEQDTKNIVEVDLVEFGGGGGGGGHPGPEGPAVSAPKAEHSAPPAEPETSQDSHTPDTPEVVRPDVKSEATTSSQTSEAQSSSSLSSELTEAGGGGGTGNGIGTGDGDGVGSGSGGGSGDGTGGGHGSGHGTGDGPGSGSGEGRVRPEVLSSVKPDYPEDLFDAGIEGVVQVGLTISVEGDVLSAWLISSSGYPSMDQAAVDVVYKWRFIPAKDNGIPFETNSNVRIWFNLDEE